MTSDKDARTWATVLHLTLLAGYTVVPLAGLIAPIVIWQIKKNEFPEIDAHGRNARTGSFRRSSTDSLVSFWRLWESVS